VSDPPRLSRDSGSDAERRLARLVEASQRDVGSDEQVAALESRLVPLIGPPLASGTTAPLPKTASVAGSGAVKAMVVSGAAAIATAAYVFARQPPPTPAAARVTAPALAVSAPAAGSSPAPVAPLSTQEPRTEAPTPSTTVKGAPLPSETELVGEAQAVLATNPARTLALCDRHQRFYPRGVLVQEREVLAIEALERLGRHEQASARGTRFLAAFPGSAHRSKIAAIVGSR
jgi:hypothetical protein